MMSKFLTRIKGLHSFKIAVMVMLSRVLGFIRDAVFAAFLGAGTHFDAFAMAYRIPNMMRDLLAEGALSSAVVSRLGHVEVKSGAQRVKDLVQRLFAFWGIVFVVVCVLGILLAPYIASVMAMGFRQTDGKFEETVRLTRVVFPYLGMVGLAALSMGILQHYRNFVWASSTSVFFNLTLISLTVIYFFKGGEGGGEGVYWIAWFVVIAGAMQWLCQIPALFKNKIRLFPKFDFKDEEIMRIVKIILPSILSVAAIQINVAVNSFYAGFLFDGAVSVIYFAFRLMQLPVGVIAVAVSSVLLPSLARLHAKGEEGEFDQKIYQALINVSFFSIPAIAGLYVLGVDIVELLFMRGEFDQRDAELTYVALSGYLPGILVYGFNKNLIQGYFARNDIGLTVKISILTVFLNAGLNYYLTFYLDMGVFGLTLGSSAVLFANCFLLYLGLKLKHGLRISEFQFAAGIVKITLSAVVMAFALIQVEKYWGVDAELWMKVGGFIVLGALVYFATFFILNKMSSIMLNRGES